MKNVFFLIVLLNLLYTNSLAQTPRIDFENYNPASTLVVPQHLLTKAKFPFIDIHNHQPMMASQNLSTLTAAMDSLNMRVMVNLSGIGGERLKAMLDKAKQYPKRFILFTNL